MLKSSQVFCVILALEIRQLKVTIFRLVLLKTSILTVWGCVRFTCLNVELNFLLKIALKMCLGIL